MIIRLWIVIGGRRNHHEIGTVMSFMLINRCTQVEVLVNEKICDLNIHDRRLSGDDIATLFGTISRATTS